MADTAQAERLQWFRDARLGMFIHFGLYSLLGRAEWVMYQEQIPREEYAALADRFAPDRFDADTWVRLAKEAGCRYMVLTARHHDGFCLYDSKVSDFTSVKTAAKRDFVAEYTDACRRHGMKVGLYYSWLDWRFDGFYDRFRYPGSKDAMIRQAAEQVDELMTRYGKIDLLWYDGLHIPYTNPDRLSEEWGVREINARAREKQPHLIINNRGGSDAPEDYDTPEQYLADSGPDRLWETCMTLGEGWGYTAHETNRKTLPQLLQSLGYCAAREGNFLVNVSPKPDGTIPNWQAGLLRDAGSWLSKNGEAVYASRRAPMRFPLLGETTRRGDRVYVIVYRMPEGEMCLPGVGPNFKRAALLEIGQELTATRKPDSRLILSGYPADLSHAYASVVVLEFDGEPTFIGREERKEGL